MRTSFLLLVGRHHRDADDEHGDADMRQVHAPPVQRLAGRPAAQAPDDADDGAA
jgi:hypothetical protein